jgi:hypothetical protein
MYTCVSMTPERGLDAMEHPKCCTNLVGCILYALPVTFYGVKSVCVYRIYLGSPHVEICRIEVW